MRHDDAIHLRKVHGFSREETAGMLGIAVGTLNHHMHEAVLLIKAALVHAGWEPELIQLGLKQVALPATTEDRK